MIRCIVVIVMKLFVMYEKVYLNGKSDECGDGTVERCTNGLVKTCMFLRIEKALGKSRPVGVFISIYLHKFIEV